MTDFHRPFWVRYSPYAVLILTALSALFGLFKPAARLFCSVFIDYNEGWMAYFSSAAISGSPLYRPMEEFVLNNYPPLSFYLVGIVGSWLGDTIMAGRLMALAGLLVTAVLSGILVRRMTGSAKLSLCGGFVLLGYMGFHHEDYVAMNDPQWMAHALMMSGLIVFLARREKRGGLILTALLFVVAGLIKHSLVAIPLAATIWLYQFERARFLFWIVCFGGTIALALIVVAVVHGPLLFESILMAPRVYHPGSVARAGVWLLPAAIYVAGAGVFLITEHGKPEENLVKWILMVSLAASFVMIGGDGVYTNALYEFILFSVVASLVQLKEEGATVRSNGMEAERKRTMLLWIFVMPVVLVAPFRFYQSKEYVRNLDSLKQHAAADITFVSQFRDPVLCENLALAFWARRSFVFDVFTTMQKLKTGRMEFSHVGSWLDERRFTLIQLNDEEGRSLSSDLMGKIRTHYRVAAIGQSGAVFWVPK